MELVFSVLEADASENTLNGSSGTGVQGKKNGAGGNKK